VYEHNLKKKLRRDYDNFVALTQLAIFRLFQHEDLKAVRLLRRALSVKSSYTPALVTVAELLRFTGRSETAKKYYEMALNHNQQQSIATKGLFEACCTSRRTEEAQKHLESILKLNTDLAAQESDLFDDDDFKVNLAFRLRESDQHD